MSKRSASSAGETIYPILRSSSGRMSMRSGAIAVRTVNRFLAAAKNASHAAHCTLPESQGKSCQKKMSEKDAFKCSPKLMEAAKRDTLLSRYLLFLLIRMYYNIDINFFFNWYLIDTSCFDKVQKLFRNITKSISQPILHLKKHIFSYKYVFFVLVFEM